MPLKEPVAAVAASRPARRSRLDDRVLFRLAVTVAAAPILIAAIRNGLLHWYPAVDTAVAAVRVNDVFSAHPPLLGLPAYPSVTSGLTYNYPGALFMYLLAIPVKVLGVSWGLLLGMAALNTGWFVAAMWLIRRRVGYRLGLIACVFGASLLWGMGSQLLVDPTPVQAGVIAFLAFLVAGWSVAEGDAKALPVLAVAANFLVLTHLKFALVVPLVGLCALVAWVWRLRRRRAGDPDDWPREYRRQRRYLIASALITVIVWIPPLVQQFAFPGGNLGHLLRAASAPSSGDAARRTLLDAFGVVSSPITTWPLWFRDSIANPNFTVEGPTSSFLLGGLGVAIVVVLAVLVGRNAVERRDATVLTGLAVGGLAWFGWTVSAFVSPDRNAYNPNYFQDLWPLAVFVWLMLALGLARSGWAAQLRRSGSVRATSAVFAVGVVTVFAVSTIPIANLGGNTGTEQDRIPTARKVAHGVRDRIPPGGPVLVRSNLAFNPLYMADVLLGLQAADVPFRVPSGFWTRTYGSHRDIGRDSDRIDRELLVTHDPATAPDDARLIVHTQPTFGPEYRETSRMMQAWALTVTKLQIPATLGYAAEERQKGDARLAGYLAQARAEEKTVLDLPWAVTALAGADTAFIDAVIQVPGLTTEQIQTWLQMRSRELLDSVWVYLIPR